MKRDEKGLLLVSASERCELFEESQIDALAPIRECWFCKWSDFRRSTRGFLQESPCHHPKNSDKAAAM